MKFEFQAVSYRVKKPVQTATGPMDLRRGFGVTLSSQGLTGRGECILMPSFGTESFESAHEALQKFVPQGLPKTLEEVSAAVLPLAQTPATAFAVECCFLEFLALQNNVPVASLLSQHVRSQLQVNALIEGDDAGALAQAAERAASEGFRTVKTKVAARPLGVDAQRLLAVRKAVGPAVKIRIDANAGWTEATARSALRGLEALELEVCEQPVTRGDVEGMRRIRHLVPCRIAADETMLVKEALKPLLRKDPYAAADVVVIKPAALGGLLPSLRLAREAWAAGMSSYVTTMMDGPLSRAAAAHLAAVLPDDAWAHGLSTVELLEGVEIDAFTPRQGVIHMPQLPGWGL
jgi:o-succinylbenzoate synthase